MMGGANGARGWLPSSPCGVHCLPVPGSVPSVGWPLQWARLAGVAALLLAGLPTVVVCLLLPPASRERLVRRWFAAVLWAFGVRLRVTGDTRFGARGSGTLVVLNHMSWLDIVALNAIQCCRMVAKSEVRGWPVVGWLAVASGTIFIDRERLHSLPATIADMATALRAGECVAVFPEGTTSCGVRFGPYRRAGFQAAIDAGVAVRPVVVRFRLEPGGWPTTAAAYVGSDTLWESMRRVAGLRGLVVEAELMRSLSRPGYRDRRALAAAAHAALVESSRRATFEYLELAGSHPA
jgi:1-acyl-sn-glycerol-3-phosphate acyltransferase